MKIGIINEGAFFSASQGEDLLLRYRLTSRPGYDPAASSRFAMETTVPPIIVRVPGANVGTNGQFLQVSPEGTAEIQIKRAADGRGLVLHAYNLTGRAQDITLTFPAIQVVQAWLCSPIEDDLQALPITAGTITLPIAARSIACARIVTA